MSKIVSTILLSLVIAAMLPYTTQADTYVKPLNTSKEGYLVLANEISAKYAVPASSVKKIIKCESNWNPKAHHLSSKEDSYGLVQINRKAHPSISVKDATDPGFAIDYLASNLAKGNARMWSCKA